MEEELIQKLLKENEELRGQLEKQQQQQPKPTKIKSREVASSSDIFWLFVNIVNNPEFKDSIQIEIKDEGYLLKGKDIIYFLNFCSVVLYKINLQNKSVINLRDRKRMIMAKGLIERTIKKKINKEYIEFLCLADDFKAQLKEFGKFNYTDEGFFYKNLLLKDYWEN